MATTGQVAWCVTLLLTEPIRSLANPPLSRDPTTSMSASCEALTSSSAASPVVALRVTSGTGLAGFARDACPRIAWSAFRASSGS